MRALCVPHVIAGLRPAEVLGIPAKTARDPPFVAPGPSRESLGDSSRVLCEGPALLILLHIAQPRSKQAGNSQTFSLPSEP
jgi:hypothetical protein